MSSANRPVVVLTLKDADDLATVRKWVTLAAGLGVPLSSPVEVASVSGLSVHAWLEDLADYEDDEEES